MYKDTEDKREQIVVSMLSTELNRLNARPINGRLYYVYETNELWIFSSNKWEIVVGNSKLSSGYSYSNTSYILTGTSDNQVIDNNGLLKDGSVVVRDDNRIIKGKLYIDTTDNNLVISSFMGGGITFYPNGYSYSPGTLRINPNTTVYMVDRETGKRIISSDLDDYVNSKIEEIIQERIDKAGGDSLSDDEKTKIRNQVLDEANNGLLKQEIMQSKVTLLKEQRVDGYAIYNGSWTVTEDFYVQRLVEDTSNSTGYTEKSYKVYHEGNLDPSVFASAIDLSDLQDTVNSLREEVNRLKSIIDNK